MAAENANRPSRRSSRSYGSIGRYLLDIVGVAMLLATRMPVPCLRQAVARSRWSS